MSFNGSDEYVMYEGFFLYETDAAILLSDEDPLGDEGEGSGQWIPKSLVEDWDDYACTRGDFVDINIKLWFAEKEGLV